MLRKREETIPAIINLMAPEGESISLEPVIRAVHHLSEFLQMITTKDKEILSVDHIKFYKSLVLTKV